MLYDKTVKLIQVCNLERRYPCGVFHLNRSRCGAIKSPIQNTQLSKYHKGTLPDLEMLQNVQHGRCDIYVYVSGIRFTKTLMTNRRRILMLKDRRYDNDLS